MCVYGFFFSGVAGPRAPNKSPGPSGERCVFWSLFVKFGWDTVVTCAGLTGGCLTDQAFVMDWTGCAADVVETVSEALCRMARHVLSWHGCQSSVSTSFV